MYFLRLPLFFLKCVAWLVDSYSCYSIGSPLPLEFVGLGVLPSSRGVLLVSNGSRFYVAFLDGGVVFIWSGAP